MVQQDTYFHKKNNTKNNTMPIFMTKKNARKRAAELAAVYYSKNNPGDETFSIYSKIDPSGQKMGTDEMVGENHPLSRLNIAKRRVTREFQKISQEQNIKEMQDAYDKTIADAKAGVSNAVSGSSAGDNSSGDENKNKNSNNSSNSNSNNKKSSTNSNSAYSDLTKKYNELTNKYNSLFNPVKTDITPTNNVQKDKFLVEGSKILGGLINSIDSKTNLDLEDLKRKYLLKNTYSDKSVYSFNNQYSLNDQGSLENLLNNDPEYIKDRKKIQDAALLKKEEIRKRVWKEFDAKRTASIIPTTSTYSLNTK